MACPAVVVGEMEDLESYFLAWEHEGAASPDGR
jgi:hypothetical protein